LKFKSSKFTWVVSGHTFTLNKRESLLFNKNKKPRKLKEKSVSKKKNRNGASLDER